jgi:hypothetical protein
MLVAVSMMLMINASLLRKGPEDMTSIRSFDDHARSRKNFKKNLPVYVVGERVVGRVHDYGSEADRKRKERLSNRCVPHLQLDVDHNVHHNVTHHFQRSRKISKTSADLLILQILNET